MLRHKILLIVLLALLFVPTVDIWSQCPMCRMAAESNLENGGTTGKGLNTGILYMLMMPYFLVTIIGIVWYRSRKKEIFVPEE